MNKAPAFQFYPKDFLSDSGVRRMSLEHRGALITLLCEQWLEGSLPQDLEQLAEICNVPAARMERLWERLSACFVPLAEGRIVNRRLEREREAQALRRAERSASGRRGAETRWLSQEDEIAQPSVPDGSAMAQPSTPVAAQPKIRPTAQKRPVVAAAAPAEANSWNAAVSEVFNYWKETMATTSPFDSKTKQIIRARLIEGFSVTDLKAAIDGCKASEWHMGSNPDKQLLNDITIICRDGAQVRKLAAKAKSRPTTSTKPEPIPYFLTPEFIAADEAALAERLAKQSAGAAQ